MLGETYLDRGASTAARTEPAAAKRFGRVIALLAALAIAGQVITALRSRHEITQVESIVAFHALMLANGEGLYYDFEHYPFTVSPYGPVFYSAVAMLHQAGIPVLLAGRLISLAALMVLLYLCWRLLLLHTRDQTASVAGTLLIASTANLLNWGTVGQTDMLGLCFSIAAFYYYSLSRSTGRLAPLIGSGVCIALAIFTKQSFIAAGASVALLAFLDSRRRGLWFTICLAGCGLSLALGLNTAVDGRYFQNAVLANLNPFSGEKIWQHLQYFLPAAGGLLLLTAAALVRGGPGRFHPLHLYLLASAAVMALTAPKVGSDLNYQIETMVLLGLCAGWSLHRLDFFRLWLRHDPGWITLMQIPLLLHLVLNLALTGKTVLLRNLLEQSRRQELAALRPYLTPEKRVLSVQIDPLLQAGKPLEVEPLIYTLLVHAGLVDPEPVRRDLEDRRFSLVILYDDIFGNERFSSNPEVPSLPKVHLDEIRKHYRLVAHIPGPLLAGDYLYEPIAEPAAGGGPERAEPSTKAAFSDGYYLRK
jgi:hypothetical protein